ncbi:extracellular solute-binding protein [Devosia sp. ZB163]|uniref:extracellular solute-binding protein n=1 Tax=Devosia sp. ZB163 TaxID=3025938 RepID=UPI0023622862|nr:extracellular solute-binding protein [Devosia sp. ZB163]MDC9823397.1 extracellular solute-binding protein [Devosia sp. ZB163]
MRTVHKGILAGIGLMLASSTSVLAQELTIFWAEWDPANYLQELVNDYTAETGVTVTVQTTPWSDFQTKTFAELNAQGDAYDMVVGDSQWLGAASEGGHYVDLTKFITDNGVDKSFVPATLQYYSLYGDKYWSVPLEGDANGWAYRKDWFEDPTEMANFKAKYGYDLGVPKNYKELTDIAEFFTRPDENKYGVALYTQTSYDAMAMGVEQTIFTWGGDLGDYANKKVTGILNSPQNIEALEAYRKLYTFTPPNWNQAFFVENNQAFTEGLVAMAMNYFAFFPALANEATNPHAKSTGYFANPPGPTGAQHAALGGQGISIISYSKNQEEAYKFLQWFIRDDVQQKWADLGGYTCSAAVLNSEGFLKATPYNQAFADSMKIVKDFWAVPVFADMLFQMNDRLHPYITTGEGTAKDALDALVGDWNKTLGNDS